MTVPDPDRLHVFNTKKRVLDLILIGITLPVTLPLGALTSLLVRWKLGAPVLFRQARAGLHGETFEVLKLRTMTDERDAHGNLMPDHVRLTPLGKMLRATSLDEVPQLVNVARGEMSLVGPRPLFVRYLPFYSERERQRHLVRPGITGLAQVAGRNRVQWGERLALDVEYVARASLAEDMKILAMTVQQVFQRAGVSVLASESGEPLDVDRSYPDDGLYRLRRLKSSDLSARVAWATDERVRRHMRWSNDLTLETTRDWFERTRRDAHRVDLVMYSHKDVNQPVAMAGLTSTDAGAVEMYVFVDPSRHGQGLGTRATDLVLRYVKERTPWRCVSLSVATANVAALRIYQSRGFVETCRSKDRVWMELSL